MHRTLLPLLVLPLPLLGGEFINLDFNEPDLTGPSVPIFPGGPVLGPASRFVRGWTITADGVIQQDVTYSAWNQTSGNSVATLRQGTPDSQFGNYLFLISQNHNDGRPGPDFWLSQTGLVPTNAEGLWVVGSGGVEGYLNGIKLGYIDPNIRGWTIWNVAAYQGKEVTLQFHVKPGEAKEFDIIGFTTVPEPSEYAMVGMGLGLLGFHAWSRTRHRALQPSGGIGSTQAPSSSSTPA